mmetsp:Transcript_11932/g.26555  ORF Transcript_11932/g.26555 Transcript_11932/m.26555 type:complete len:187 (-) Transcript_11932:20-580(-)
MGEQVLDGYILSAGLDQRVYLWSLTGKCVGEFGSFGWDINNPRTWHNAPLKDQKTRKKNSGQGKKHEVRKENTMDSAEIMAARTAQMTSAGAVTKDSGSLVKTPSTLLIQNIGQHAHSSQELNDYVVALSRKIASRPPATADGDSLLLGLAAKHPMQEEVEEVQARVQRQLQTLLQRGTAAGFKRK